MNHQEQSVATVDALVAATKDAGVQHIVASGFLTNAPSIRLSSGQSLRGDGGESRIAFAAGTDGLQLSSALSGRRVTTIRTTGSMERP